MKKIGSLIILLNFFINTTAHAQTDTVFWFAAPDISSAFSYDRPIYFRITSMQQPCTVTVSQPAGGGFPTQTFTMPANTTQSVDLTNWISNIECGPGDVIQNRGLKIVSNNNIAVYYEVNANAPNPELFSLKGKNALGNQFYISSQYFLNNTSIHTPTPISSFNIVATEDNSVVTIRTTNDIVGHLANSSFTFTLNRGQTYAAIATSTLAAQHLQGSYVSSTKPVAITLADDLLKGAGYGGACEDLAGDQTVPVNIVGSEYIAFKSNLNSPYDKVYITATQNGTAVNQDGILKATLNAGQSTELSVVNPTTYIKLSAPGYAYELSGYSCEVGSAVLPKINCTGSSSVSILRSTNESFTLTLLIKNGGQGSFLVNNTSGVITAAQFSVVPGTGGLWYGAKVSLPISIYPNGSVIKVSNTTNIFQMGVLQGEVLGVGFGYFSDFNTLQANAFSTTMSLCAGGTIRLFADTIVSSTYSWKGPNGFISNLQNPFINNASTINSGDYILNVTVPGCGSYYDTLNITVKPRSFTNISQSICQGQTYFGHSSGGTYIDTFLSVSGCDSVRTVNLTIKPKSFSIINQSICQGSQYLGHSTTGIFIDTLLAANGCDSIRTLNLVVNPSPVSSISQTICTGQTYLGYSISGVYKDTFATTSGCDSMRTLILTVNDLPKPDLGPDAFLCSSDTLSISPGKFLSYIWQDGSVMEQYTVRKSGFYSVTVTNNCGSAADNILVSDKSCNVYFPTVFTPNKDGKNEVFKILNATNLQDFYMALYNRWGQKIFETRDYTKGWDGTVGGEPVEIGAYVWNCEFKKLSIPNRFRGTVILVR